MRRMDEWKDDRTLTMGYKVPSRSTNTCLIIANTQERSQDRARDCSGWGWGGYSIEYPQKFAKPVAGISFIQELDSHVYPHFFVSVGLLTEEQVNDVCRDSNSSSLQCFNPLFRLALLMLSCSSRIAIEGLTVRHTSP